MEAAQDFETFERLYQAGQPQCLALRLVSDLETPVSAYLKLKSHAGEQPSFLLESVEGGATRGRHSIIGLLPDLVWRCRNGASEIARNGSEFASIPGKPLEALRAVLAESRIPALEHLPPMASGVFGFMGYDMVREMERLAPAKPDQIGVPDALMIRPTVVLIFDNVKDELVVVTPVFPKEGASAKAAHESALERLNAVMATLDAPLEHAGRPADLSARIPEAQSNTSREEFHAMVARAKEYILAGDIFQVVLSQRFFAPFDLDAFSLYRALRRVNPSPYLCYLDFQDFQIVCSSPEILVKVVDGPEKKKVVCLRPLAGTRRRGATPAEDMALEKDLLADPKERAEHLMLLDLGRNDVGRVAKMGSVKVTDSFFIERYSQVMHIVSHVEGELDSARYDILDALAAGFPAGTTSGAPKIRAMEIIDELEKDKRGTYAGTIGYFGADGAMDTCIMLRTALVKDGMMHVQAGAGIVHDSVPASEQAECENKAKALFRAAEEAVRFASQAKRGQ
ncbi:MAG: anthranilate synthase component I [Methylobacterium sp.]|nr:anthranilate synthase component I [Methylobacterium sp.]MCA3604840.1 anthranilate synthase component I [Methylobacterium sp.]MCA3615189.1 anthranilate synthase component I [Methylobacterium sp.]MCA4910989.1 anthranilate synthase component I [Methylobacterium sp.]